MDEIKETIKIDNGKPKYCLQAKQGEAKIQIYIRNGEIYFESCNYSFDNYPVFDFNNNAHILAKEMFISSLKVDIKNKILELKQLEAILDQLNLKNVIDDELKKGSILLAIKNKLLGKKEE